MKTRDVQMTEVSFELSKADVEQIITDHLTGLDRRLRDRRGKPSFTWSAKGGAAKVSVVVNTKIPELGSAGMPHDAGKGA